MRRSILKGVVLVAFFATGSASAGSSTQVQITRESGVTQLITAESDARALSAKARAAGSIRVIAVLDLAFGDPGAMSEAEIADQTARLRAVQDAVIRRALGGDRNGVTTFDLVPYLALSVTPEQLHTLASDPAVLSVQEDGTAAPSAPQAAPKQGSTSQ